MIRLLYGRDCLDVLREMPANSVHCCVTSPPYYGLRSYLPAGHADKASEIGLEPSLSEYIARLVAVFEKVRRVLRDDGTFWLNIGDSYNSGTQFNHHKSGLGSSPRYSEQPDDKSMGKWAGHRKPIHGLKPKDLCMVPARLALALQDAGWWLRSEIVWSKKSPMPSSVTDRHTVAHEMIYMFAKSARYFYDAEPIKEPAVTAGAKIKMADGWDTGEGGHGTIHRNGREKGKPNNAVQNETRNAWTVWTMNDEAALLRWLANQEGGVELAKRFFEEQRNAATVWQLGTESFPGSHFATYPTEIPRRAILAGTSAHGCCPACLAPYRRVTERTQRKRARPNDLTKRTGTDGTGNHCGNTVAGVDVKTVGWEPTCKCNAGEPRACTVLDPFSGSGTTGQVAFSLGREYIGIDLSTDYLDLARERCGGLFVETT